MASNANVISRRRRIVGWGGLALAALLTLGAVAWKWPSAVRIPGQLSAAWPFGLGRQMGPDGRRSARSLSPKEAARAVGKASDAYAAGRFHEAETLALDVVQRSRGATAIPPRNEAARAEYVLAYATARRGDFRLSRARFALLRDDAARLPGHGRLSVPHAAVPSTLEEEGAYQHAILTAALGDRAGAEREYRAFVRRYPESPLLHGVMLRIGRLHGGNIPAADEALWNRAQRIAQASQRARARATALCGPECVAEVLKRRGQAADVARLAKEMRTGANGTCADALAKAAKRHGLAGKGLSLTAEGLKRQRLPVIALVRPAHYVVVDQVKPDSITVWDPDGRGKGLGRIRRYSTPEWQRLWRGVAITTG